MNHATISLAELIDKAKRQLDLLGYAERTKKYYTLNWRNFLNYAEQRGHNYFSKQLGIAFLKDCYGIKSGIKLTTSQVYQVRTVTILGEILDHNHFLRCHQKPGKQTPKQFHKLVEKFEKQQIENNILKQTIRRKKSILTRFLIFLDGLKITDIKTLSSHEVLSYLGTLEKYSSSTKSGIMFALRQFLFFLHSEGAIKEPLNNLFPVIFSNKYEKIPSYYSVDEIHAILCQVDRNTEFGRRDYLILLLAVQLGMRAGDIRRLQFKNIKLSRNTIEFVQQKTKKPLQLPLTEALKYALADYLKNSRPKENDQHIFIRHSAPFQPFSVDNSFYNVINKHMDLAGIKPNNRKHGLHSMRHSTANNLLRNCTPYPVISGILGHDNLSTTKLYLRIDIQQLRTVALEVPNDK
ncbi:MAG: tyrosine-type recombinase/integrase [Deltaproteobacteria bacterium]|nr:tyrosine-type recombinase/integrase [Deltaproteobacteria bacterium]